MATSNPLQGNISNLQGNVQNLQGTTPILQGSGAISTGLKAPSPVTNTVKPLPKLTQAAQKDLSGIYANVGGTIYNKQSGTKFANSADFFKDSGQNNFNAKFDTSYTPTGNESIYGQAPKAPTSPIVSNTPAPVTPPASTVDSNALYIPPNQGTTGVSQGGIVGNLLNIARNESPEVAKARQTLQDLQNNYGQASADINSRPEGLTQQTGQQGILANLFAAKQNAAQTALSSALTSQGQQIGATSSAGGLNAPQFVSPGQVQVSPTQPVAGSTTSGAANLNSLIGTRVGADGKTTEYFDKSTGKGFSNPQQLADYVNSQTPGVNATKDNVFSILQQQGQGGNNIVGGNSSLNPLSQVGSIASQVLSGQLSPNVAYGMGGSVQNWASVLNSELQKQQPGFDVGTAQAKYDANQSVQTQQGQQVGQMTSALQSGKNLQSQLSNLILSKGVNPSDINAFNTLIQTFKQNTSSNDYKQLENLLTDIVATYSSILTPGSSTDTARATAASLLSSNGSGQNIIDTMAALDRQATAKIAGIKTSPTTGSPNSSNNPGNSNSSSGGEIPAGALKF